MGLGLVELGLDGFWLGWIEMGWVGIVVVGCDCTCAYVDLCDYGLEPTELGMEVPDHSAWLNLCSGVE